MLVAVFSYIRLLEMQNICKGTIYFTVDSNFSNKPLLRVLDDKVCSRSSISPSLKRDGMSEASRVYTREQSILIHKYG